jgi:hypothetical protein
VGLPVDLVATLDDTRFNNESGFEPTQDIAAVEYYVDVPPWSPGATPVGMLPVDGSFDESVEPVSAVVSTAGLEHGRHTLFVRGQDAAGNWGAVSAAFITVEDDLGDQDGDGVANGVDCDPLDATVWAVPTAARDLTITKDLFDNVTWVSPANPGSAIVGYHLLRSGADDDFQSANCTLTGTGTDAAEHSIPASGAVFHYLVRAQNRCGQSLGYDSSGQPRTGTSCAP